MKTEEDEAFDELAKRQGDWGGGFQAKRAAAADKLQEPSITRPCRSCDGTGDRDTGIPESPIATCNPCNGTGQIALAQPAQEPVAWRRVNGSRFDYIEHRPALRGWVSEEWEPLGSLCMTPPPLAPKRTWVGLTDEEREQHRNDWYSNIHDKEFYAIEAKLKEKNNGT